MFVESHGTLITEIFQLNCGMADPETPLPKAPKGKDEFAEYTHPDDVSFDKFVAALDRAYHRPFQMMFRSFLSGLMSAIGAAVGAALILLLTGFLLAKLGGVQVFKPFVESIQNMVLDNPAFKNVSQENTQSNQATNAPYIAASPSPSHSPVQ